MSLKVAFIHNRLIHYRVPLFNRLVDGPFKVDFFFGSMDKRIFKMVSNKKLPLAFKYTILPSVDFSEGLCFSPMLLFALIKHNYEVIVGSWVLNPDTIIAFIYAKLLHRPFVLWEERYIWTTTLTERLTMPIQLFIIKRSDAIVVPGSKAKNFFKSLTGKDNVFIAPNSSLPLGYPQINKITQIRKEIRKGQILLFVGNLIPAYRVDLIIKALAILVKDRNDISLIICGDGPLKSNLRCLSQELKVSDNVIFTGFVSDVENYYPLADVVVVPYEGIGPWGLVLNEAAYFGKPIISSANIGASYDFVKEGVNGYLLSNTEEAELSRLIAKVLDDPKMKENAEDISKQLVDEFSFDNMTSGFIKAIEYSRGQSKILHCERGTNI